MLLLLCERLVAISRRLWQYSYLHTFEFHLIKSYLIKEIRCSFRKMQKPWEKLHFLVCSLEWQRILREEKNYSTNRKQNQNILRKNYSFGLFQIFDGAFMTGSCLLNTFKIQLSRQQTDRNFDKLKLEILTIFTLSCIFDLRICDAYTFAYTCLKFFLLN